MSCGRCQKAESGAEALSLGCTRDAQGTGESPVCLGGTSKAESGRRGGEGSDGGQIWGGLWVKGRMLAFTLKEVGAPGWGGWSEQRTGVM